MSRAVFISFLSLSLSGATAWADTAGTGGGSETGASSAGSQGAEASQNTNTTSVAVDHGKTSEAGTSTQGTAWSGSDGRRSGSRARVHTQAYAKARTHKRGVQAVAAAAVSVEAAAWGSGGFTAVGLDGVGYATAYSLGGYMGAFATSGTGTYAQALSGRRGGLLVSAPQGTTATYNRGRLSYAIAYTTTGTFSIAVQTRHSVSAMTGTSANATALASGNLRTLASSGVFASAYADRTMASAFASAFGVGDASGGKGYASASSYSSAFAVAVRTGTAKVAVSGREVCVSYTDRKTKKRRNECSLLPKQFVSYKLDHNKKQVVRVTGNWNTGLVN